MNEIVCPNCGEDENLKGDSKESGNAEKVTVICETCEIKWERDLTQSALRALRKIYEQQYVQ